MSNTETGEKKTLRQELDEFTTQKIGEALAACGGNASKAAQALGMRRSTLGDWIRRLGIVQ
jgi:transcriptional regulator with GAF, ATPase, and Fis domain